MKVFQVIHEYELDGGYGDAVGCEEVVAVFENEEDAKAFVKRFARPHIYDKPYDYLTCGELSISEVEIVLHKDFNLENWDKSEFSWNGGGMGKTYKERS